MEVRPLDEFSRYYLHHPAAPRKSDEQGSHCLRGAAQLYAVHDRTARLAGLAMCADSMALSVAPLMEDGKDKEEGFSEEIWSLEPFSAMEEGTFMLRLRNLTHVQLPSTLPPDAPPEEFFAKALAAHVDYFAVAVTVKIEERYLCLLQRGHPSGIHPAKCVSLLA